MKITKKHIVSLSLVLFFAFVQIAGILLVQNCALAGTSLWDSQQGMGLSGGGQGVIGDVGFSADSSDVSDIRTVVANVINVFLGFLGIIFTVLLVIAGMKWMNSQGNETVIAEAKGQIQAALIGIIIIVSAYGVTQLVMRYAVDATF